MNDLDFNQDGKILINNKFIPITIPTSQGQTNSGKGVLQSSEMLNATNDQKIRYRQNK